jgi:hypothetical protein
MGVEVGVGVKVGVIVGVGGTGVNVGGGVGVGVLVAVGVETSAGGGVGRTGIAVAGSDPHIMWGVGSMSERRRARRTPATKLATGNSIQILPNARPVMCSLVEIGELLSA